MQEISGSRPTSVMFVCLGNICRSPIAEGVFRAEATARGLSNRFHFSSAGTGGWHEGEPPNTRSVAICAQNGVDISGQRARKLLSDDFDRFDHIYGMDRNNVSDIRKLASGGAAVALFMQATLGRNADVPDPYYGTFADYENVYRMVREAADSWFVMMAGRANG